MASNVFRWMGVELHDRLVLWGGYIVTSGLEDVARQAECSCVKFIKDWVGKRRTRGTLARKLLPNYEAVLENGQLIRIGEGDVTDKT